MKKYILILVFIIFSLSLFASNTFYLTLNKTGVDRVWFSEVSDETKTSINRHIFPLVSGNEPDNVSSTIYLNWDLQSGKNVSSIKVTFMGDDTENRTDKSSNGYMLRRSKNGDYGINYDVSITKPGTTTSYGSITVDTSSIITTLSLDNRQVTIKPSTSVTSPALITMTVNKPSYDSSYGWIEAQYVGYIKAEIIYGT